MQPKAQIAARMPAWSDVLTAFHFTIFAIASWSVKGYLFRFPSLLLRFDVLDLLSVLGYMMAFALLESIAVIALLFIASMCLPRGWLSRGFAYKAPLAVLVAGMALLVLQKEFQNALLLIAGVAVAFLAWLLLSIWLQKAPKAQQAAVRFLGQFAVFSYIYVPLGLIGIVVVLVRNLI